MRPLAGGLADALSSPAWPTCSPTTARAIPAATVGFPPSSGRRSSHWPAWNRWPHASWLNQGELLNHAFGYRSLRRRSWTSREEYITHVDASWPEYNQLYTHPFEGTWTNHRMRHWFAEHAD